MNSTNDDGARIYKILVNDQDQYSLWSDLSPPPSGWHEVKSGDRQECLDYVKATWKDMRLRSQRET